jgi:ABC-2 type transport system ATP-binding protein
MTPPAVAFDGCAKWYGQVLGLANITWTASRGVIGLLGPNGAGKSTLIKLTAGLLAPSRGSCEVFGRPIVSDTEIRRRIGYSPEHEGIWGDLSAHEFVTALAEMAGVPHAKAGAASDAALERMGMSDARNRRLRGFSKGMRQRIKLAQAIAHDPDLLLLDEPLTGVDPLARRAIIDQVRALGAAGKTVIVSSHVLPEIEALTDEILVIYRGQVLAEGNVARIRDLIDRFPHRIRVGCTDPRRLGAALAAAEHVERLAFERDTVLIETRDPDRCYERLGELAAEGEVDIQALSSPDNSLGAVFEYLTAGRSAR